MRVNGLITEAWPGPPQTSSLKFFILDISGGHGYTSGPLIEVKNHRFTFTYFEQRNS